MTAQDLARRMAQLDFMREYGDLEPARARELKRAARLAYGEEARKRKQARHAVEVAVRQGKLHRPERCEACGRRSVQVLEGHHVDHSKPLSVDWLCSSEGGCHGKADRKGILI